MPPPVRLDRLFIASTQGRLTPYREAAIEVCHLCEIVPVHMGQFYGHEQPPIHVCRSKVGEAHGLLLLIGTRYGNRPPGEELSFTELEYLEARRLGLPIFPWAVDRVHASADPMMRAEADDPEALERFRALVEKEHTVSQFGDLHQFQLMLAVSLATERALRRQPRITHGPFPFGRVRAADPHALAEAMSNDWAAAQALVTDRERRSQLIRWLRDDVGDRSPIGFLLADPKPPSDELILEIISQYAPDLAPRFRGEPADASALAAVCERAAAGDEAAQQSLQWFTEPVLKLLARHACQTGHPGCDATGCAVLSRAAATLTEVPGVVADVLAALPLKSEQSPSPIRLHPARTSQRVRRPEPVPPRSDQSDVFEPTLPLREPFQARLQADALRATLDPAFVKAAEDAFTALPVVRRSDWWSNLAERANEATGLTRTVLQSVAVSLAGLAADQTRGNQARATLTAADKVRQDRVDQIDMLGAAVTGCAGIPVVGLLGVAMAKHNHWPDTAHVTASATTYFVLALCFWIVAEAVLLTSVVRPKLEALSIAAATASVAACLALRFAYPEFTLRHWIWGWYVGWAFVGAVLLGLHMGVSDSLSEKLRRIQVRGLRAELTRERSAEAAEAG